MSIRLEKAFSFLNAEIQHLPGIDIYTPAKQMFSGYTGISQSVCLSVCVQNTTFCRSAGFKSHLVTALV